MAVCMRVDQAYRLKELEQENSRLKELVADLSLDNDILKEAIRAVSAYDSPAFMRTLWRHR